jgi:surfeit locus 1 family protein
MTTGLRRGLVGLLALLLFSGFMGLGAWQVKRLFWKLDLIERVNLRVSAPSVIAPTEINGKEDEYRHVRVTGRFLAGKDVQVKAVTVIGSGFWLLSPLQLDTGGLVLINRGFVPPRWTAPAAITTEASVTVTGLLRLSERGGGFLRSNDPANQRWFSRDVSAIALNQGLTQVAPYFIDAQVDETVDSAQPVAGLTVIAFHNSHLIYAITWFALALMVVGAAFILARHNSKKLIA